MMPLPLGPLMSLMFSIVMMLTIVRFSPRLAMVIVLFSTTAALFLYLRHVGALPRWLMDILDRFTDKAILERAYTERNRRRPAIDSQVLFDALRSRDCGL